MNTTFSLNRLWLLLRYDFIQARRNLLLIAAVLVGIYLVMVYRNFTDDVTIFTPTAVAGTCHGVFTVGSYVGIILATLLLHRKFTNPASAPLYITLPASTLEKFACLLLDYAAVLLGVWALEWLCYAATMAVGALIFPAVNWSLPFLNDSGQNLATLFKDLTVNTINLDAETFGLSYAPVAALLCYYSLWLATLLYFICLNFHFRRNGILKSCLCLLVTYIALIFIILPIFGLWLSSHLEEIAGYNDARFSGEVVPQIERMVQVFYTLMWCSPLLPIGVGYRLYRLVSKKQIK